MSVVKKEKDDLDIILHSFLLCMGCLVVAVVVGVVGVFAHQLWLLQIAGLIAVGGFVQQIARGLVALSKKV